MKTLLPDNVKTDVACQGKQLSSCFNIKHKTKFPHKLDLVYHAKYAEESCNDEHSLCCRNTISFEDLSIIIQGWEIPGTFGIYGNFVLANAVSE